MAAGIYFFPVKSSKISFISFSVSPLLSTNSFSSSIVSSCFSSLLEVLKTGISSLFLHQLIKSFNLNLVFKNKEILGVIFDKRFLSMQYWNTYLKQFFISGFKELNSSLSALESSYFVP